MTTPKDPDHNDDISSSDKAELYDSIDELENLISNKAASVNGGNTGPAIPVLDDVIDPDIAAFSDDDEIDDVPALDPEFHEDIKPYNQITPAQVDELISTMDEKLSRDLDELVHILKDAIKESIITEIKSQLDSQIQREQPSNKEGDPPA